MKKRSTGKEIPEEKKEKIDSLLIEGYKVQKTSDKKINDEWKDITLESWDD